MGIYFFYGDEEYLIEKELNKFRSKLDKNFSEMNFVTYNELTYPDLISVLRTQPMMFGKMMIVIYTRNLLAEKGSKKQSLFSAGLDDNQLKEIESALEGNIENNNEMLDIFFVEQFSKSDKKKKPDSRKKIFKIISKYNTQEFASIPTYKTAELGNIINKMAKEKKIKITADAVETLIICKGNNLREFDIELDKLQLMAYPDTTITKSMVEEMTTSNEDIFNLVDYTMLQEHGKALLEVRRLLETKYPMEIIAPLQTMLKRAIYIKLNSKDKSYAEIGRKLNIHEFVVQKTLEKLRKIPVKNLVELKKHLTEAEYRIKKGLSVDAEEELENAIVR